MKKHNFLLLALAFFFVGGLNLQAQELNEILYSPDSWEQDHR